MPKAAVEWLDTFFVEQLPRKNTNCDLKLSLYVFNYGESGIIKNISSKEKVQNPMTIKSIKSKQDLENALKRVDELWDVAEPNTPEGNELKSLTLIIEAYENSLLSDNELLFRKSNVKFKPVDFD